ncbi:MAG TPA: YCF48-related protein [Steroidobacteraceae bacterium]|nr:YCF48-related protein [Steroidobacteraceae bacterium]
MSTPKTLLVATDGQAVLRSHDDGASWRRIKVDQDLEFDDTVRCLLPDPRAPQAVFAGAETGLFRSEDCGANWHRIDCALNSYAVWRLVADAGDPNIMYAGTGSPSRAIFFRSNDGGRHWERTSLEMPPKCLGVSRPRMLTIAIDPEDAHDVWVGVEEGGLFRTRDGGDSWKRIDADTPGGVRNSDLHSVVILPGPPKTILAMVVNAVYSSTDDGETWSVMSPREKWGLYYSRVLARKPGSDREVFMGIGDGTPGATALFLRSSDCGASWLPMPFPEQPNSVIWTIGTHPADPNLVLAGTKYGHLFRSLDGGKSWRKEWREFSEITDATWIPAVPTNSEADHAHP